ncbi:TlpA family protein disulfide reductase [Ferrimonas sediminicola]|uniref:TlpA family protein disulfide reductase n=1 Tax=Ferrimonas sediminicola TaxID=2569538 RepID=A0A4U1BH38_9GAMM|nr:TlpA disulfide reductase family protein [Ferrimonas sediminicola]TKB50565.1 TlpA family protein disulfide reductase [Ferrimonas sediminicola]
MRRLRQGGQFALLLLAALWLGGWVRAQMMSPVNGTFPSTPLPVLTQLQGDWLFNGEFSPAVGKGNRLIYLFAPWCTICKLTFPHLREWQQEGRAVTAVALSYRSGDEVIDFLDSVPGATTRVLMGDRALAGELDILAYPTYLVVDGNGVILSGRVGYLPEWMLGLYLDYYGI